MKILFICGCLEPGKDGVGDYTRLLAGELARKKYLVAIISLMDYYTDSTYEGYQLVVNQRVPVLRIKNAEKKHSIILRNYIKTFDPEWLSLQYVPYSFHSKGLPWNLPNLVKNLSKDRKCHLMLHELWLGLSQNISVKQKLIAYIQKIILKRLVLLDTVKKVSTSNKLYSEALEIAGINNSILQLFSNIPIIKLDAETKKKIFNEYPVLRFENRENYMVGGIFGSLYEDSKLENLLNFIIQECDSTRKKLVFISLGKLGESGLKEWCRIEKVFKSQVEFLILGELSSEEISQYFQIMDFGVACTPTHLLGKSGVFAAMKLHGLKIVKNEVSFLSGKEKLIQDLVQDLDNSNSKSWSVAYAADKFIKSLDSFYKGDYCPS